MWIDEEVALHASVYPVDKFIFTPVIFAILHLQTVSPHLKFAHTQLEIDTVLVSTVIKNVVSTVIKNGFDSLFLNLPAKNNSIRGENKNGCTFPCIQYI